MYTWEEAKARLARTRFGRLKLKNNTWLESNGDTFVIRHHWTNVVTITKDNHYIINCGGYRSNTTKSRINEFGSGQIYQRDFVWYVDVDGNSKLPFEDGMRFDLNGNLLGQKYRKSLAS